MFEFVAIVCVLSAEGMPACIPLHDQYGPYDVEDHCIARQIHFDNHMETKGIAELRETGVIYVQHRSKCFEKEPDGISL